MDCALKFKKKKSGVVVTPLIPALGRQRQRPVNLCEFDSSLEYIASSGTVRDTR